MTDTLISFSTAILAKEKGIDPRICGRVYVGDAKWEERIPTQSLLQKWLRENHNIHIQLHYDCRYRYWEFRIYFLNEYLSSKKDQNKVFFNIITTNKTYESALEQGLREALLLIK